jgi:hypothetical protein
VKLTAVHFALRTANGDPVTYWRAAGQELDRVNHDARVDVANSVGERNERDREAAGGDFEMIRNARTRYGSGERLDVLWIASAEEGLDA